MKKEGLYEWLKSVRLLPAGTRSNVEAVPGVWVVGVTVGIFSVYFFIVKV